MLQVDSLAHMQTQMLENMLDGMPGDILFISGWAGYKPLFPVLSRQTTFVCPFNPESGESLEAELEKYWDIIIAWSLGAHLCLKNISRLRAGRLVLLAPFLDFCHGSSWQKVQKMIHGLEKNPETTLGWFWKLCGMRPIPDTPALNIHDLQQGLRFLLKSKVDCMSLETHLPINIVHGLKDKIVPVSQSKAIRECLPHSSFHTETCGHFIPEQVIFRTLCGLRAQSFHRQFHE